MPLNTTISLNDRIEKIKTQLTTEKTEAENKLRKSETEKNNLNL